MKILHIIRNPNYKTPFEVAEYQSKKHDVAILLLHDGVYLSPNLKTYVSESDVKARNIEHKGELVGYDRIIELLFEYDKIISW